MKMLVPVLALAVAVAGCAGDRPDADPARPSAPPSETVTPAPGDHRLGVSVNGVRRTFRLHAPPAYAPGAPAVVVLHGQVADGAAMARLTGFDAIADAAGFLVVYPDAHEGNWNGYTCCGGTQDDIAFGRALVGHLTTVWRADPKRLHVVGHWSGGSLASEFAAELPGVFAAVGIVNGAYTPATNRGKPYAVATPVVLILGGASSSIIRDFETRLGTYVRDHSCTPARTAPYQGTVTRGESSCGGAPLHVYRVPGMGTEWPGPGTAATADDALFLDRTRGIDAAQVIWQFLAGHRR